MHQVYGHLGTVRHRSKVVEYRVAQHRAKLGDRLKAVRAGADLVTTCGDHEVSAHA